MDFWAFLSSFGAHPPPVRMSVGRAVDTASPPTYTANKLAAPSIDKDTGAMMIKSINGGVVGVTEYTFNDVPPASPSGGTLMVIRQDTLGNLGNADGDWSYIKCNNQGVLYVQQADLDASIDDVTIVPTAGALTNRSGTTHASADTSSQVMASNASRKYLFFKNVSDTVMWINFTAAAVKDQPSFSILPGETFTMEGSFVSTEALNVICEASAKSYCAKEA